MSTKTLQLELTTEGTVDVNANVLFDEIVHPSASISYDNTTGLITISEVGSYEIHWWVATQNSISENGAVFAIVSSQQYVSIGNSPLRAGEVVGVAIINVITAPVTVSLQNRSTEPFFYASIVPVKAAIVITSGQGEDGPTGPTGYTGYTGPAGGGGASGTVIPFATGTNTSNPATNAAGQPTQVQLVGSTGHSSNISLSGNTFILPTGDGFQFAFAMPYDAVVKSIYFTSANWAGFNPGTGASVYAFVTLATAPPGGSTFTLLTATETQSDTPWVGGSTIPAGTTISGSKLNIDVPITAGSRVAICAAYRITGTPSAQAYYFYYGGGILLE